MNALPEAYRAAADLEMRLGDPGRDGNLLSFRRAMQWDEQEAFPEAAIAYLHRLGVHRLFVPREEGGKLDSCEGFMAAGRVLARRDMNVTVSYCTMLWSMLAWIGGNGEQKRRVARWILQGGHFPCLAYSEELHGADLSSNDLRATRGPAGGFSVSGQKWPINRATRSEFLVLLARTDEGVHMRNHSLFIVDKARLDAARYAHLPRVPTHGLRGCDISGIRFDACPVPEDALIGAPGHGLELALKGFQMTRTFCTSLSLGVADSALRIVAGFASERQLYGQRVIDLPHARDVLANAYLSQLIGECTSMAAARGLHLHTEQFSTWSSVAKVQVTRLCDHAMAELGQVLGARHFLRDGPAHGMFQKLLRDGAIVSVFDGSSIICLNALAAFLPDLARGTQSALAPADVAALFDLDRSLPALDTSRLALTGRGRDAVMQSLPVLREELRRLRGTLPGPDAEDNLSQITEAADALILSLNALRNEAAELSRSARERHSAAAFALAERYGELHSGVACLGLWVHNRQRLGEFFARGRWLVAALRRSGSTRFRIGELESGDAIELCGQLRRQLQQQRMFSILPWPVAPPGAVEHDRPIHPFEQRTAHEPVVVS